MVDQWHISDPHFFHKSIIKWANDVRPFETVEEMNLTIIKNINSVVKPNDKLFIHGDMFLGDTPEEEIREIMKQINGRKTIILGNHDSPRKMKIMLEHVEAIRGPTEITGKQFDIICTHIPVHESEVEERFILNVHGHKHKDIVMKKEFNGTTSFDIKTGKHVAYYNKVPDERYFSVCVEQHKLMPVHFDVIMDHAWKIHNERKNQP